MASQSPSALAIHSGTADQGSTMQHLAMIKRLAHDRIAPPVANLNLFGPPDQEIQGK